MATTLVIHVSLYFFLFIFLINLISFLLFLFGRGRIWTSIFGLWARRLTIGPPYGINHYKNIY